MAKFKLSGYPLNDSLNIANIVSLFYHKAPRNFSVIGEQHPLWEMIYVDKGKVMITADDKNYVLKSGEIAFHRPNEFHAVRAYDNTAANYFVVAFVCQSPAMSELEHGFFFLNTQERNYLYDAYRYSQKTYQTKIIPGRITSQLESNSAVFYSQTVKNLLELLLLSIILRKDNTNPPERIDTYTKQAGDKHFVSDIEAYLEKHICENLTIEQISNDFNCSSSMLKKAFQKAHSGGIINYFIDLKVDEAKRLITESEMTISQISDNLGFQNSSYFARIFKKRVGMTPSEFGSSFKENVW
ncbi:MAG: AraC family transcriptional regulator [Clostridia bacterium]|nr:AraC family transcriptional regulator [Clostridia bacterium]